MRLRKLFLVALLLLSLPYSLYANPLVLRNDSLVVSGKDLQFTDEGRSVTIETKAFTRNNPDVTTMVTPILAYDNRGSYKFAVGVDLLQVPETVQFVLTSNQPLEATEKGVRYARSESTHRGITTTEYVYYDFTDVANAYSYPFQYIDDDGNLQTTQRSLPYKINVQRNTATITYDFTFLSYSPIRLNLDPTITITNISNYNSSNNNVTNEPTPFSHITMNDSSLIGYWNFDTNWSTTDNITYDFSSYNNEGVMAGVGKLLRYNETGYIGGGITFEHPANNGSEYFNAGNASSTNSFGTTQEVTITMWVNARNTQPAMLLVKENTTLGNGNCNPIQFRTIASNNPRFTICPGTTNVQHNGNLGNFLIVGTWVFIAGKVNATNVTFYKNGTIYQMLPRGATAIIANGTGNLIVAGAQTNSPTSFNGSIDEVMIFNRSLSNEEILSLYKAQYPKFAGPPALQRFENLSIGQTGSLNMINVTTNTSQLNNSNLSLMVLEYNLAGVNTANSSLLYLAHGSGRVNYSISTSTYNISLQFNFTPGGMNFYSPVLQDSIVIDSFNVPIAGGGGAENASTTIILTTNGLWRFTDNSRVSMVKP